MWSNIAAHCSNSFWSTKILAQHVTRYLRQFNADSLISWTCFIEMINLLCNLYESTEIKLSNDISHLLFCFATNSYNASKRKFGVKI